VLPGQVLPRGAERRGGAAAAGSARGAARVRGAGVAGGGARHRGRRARGGAVGSGAMTLSLVAIFGAGLATFASPCVLPLMPVYLAMIAGESLAQARARRTLAVASAFV